MKIVIAYEASWRNSFLDGSNNEPLPKNGRDYIASGRKLQENEANYKSRSITLDTVMGILNRLIGDQRKLYQARVAEAYFFKEVEPLVTFFDKPDKHGLSSEIVFLRNMKGNTDQNSFSGMIKTSDPVFSSDYSAELWGVLTMDLDNLTNFIIDGVDPLKTIVLDPLTVITRLESLNKLKADDEDYANVLEALKAQFPEENYTDAKGKIKPIALYCSALYLKLEQLKQRFDVSAGLSKNGLLTGIAKTGFTKKDFMKRFTTGNGKIIFGNPYQLKQRIKGQGEVVSTLNKASGTLTINLEVPRDKGQEIQTLIDNAGVSSFYLGKKGLAYVKTIHI
jgi:hypothetical protein